jgi:hypothetical protein
MSPLNDDEAIFEFLCEGCGIELQTVLSFCNDSSIVCICGYENKVSYQNDGLVRLNKALREQEEMIAKNTKAAEEQQENIRRSGLLYPSTAAGHYYDEMVLQGKYPPREEANVCGTG